MIKRKQFIQQCGLACAGGGVLMAWLQSCATQKTVSATYDNKRLIVPLTAFYTGSTEEKKWNRTTIVRHDKVPFPIVVYRLKEGEYRALLLRCTHQGSELNVYGDLISCSAHGSEFDNKGQVLQGPAETSLQSYTVNADNQNVYIRI